MVPEKDVVNEVWIFWKLKALRNYFLGIGLATGSKDNDFEVFANLKKEFVEARTFIHN